MADVEERLKHLVEYAYSKVPYFNYAVNNADVNVWELEEKCALADLPSFSKDTIIEYGYANFISSDFLDDNNHLIMSSNVRTERTSGTTRDSMEIPWEHSDYLGSIKFHWQYRKAHGNITPLSICVSGINMPRDDTVVVKNNYIYFNINNLSDECVADLFETFKTVKPEWIYTFGSVLFVLLKKAERLGLRLPDSVRYIEVVGEPFLPYYKAYAERITGMRIHDAYGCTETNGIAYTCKNGHFHIMGENVITEIVDECGKPLPYGETGYICVTGIYNRLMPFIRYRLNDMGELHKGTDCDCGNKSDYLTIHTTRLPKIVVFDDESIYDECSIFFAIDNIFAVRRPNKHSIPFCMKYHSVHTYEVTFDDASTRAYDRRHLEESVSGAMRNYGLKDVSFVFSYSDQLRKRDVNGYLELKK